MTQPAPTFPLMAGFEEYQGLPLIDVVNQVMEDPEHNANFDPSFWKTLDSWVWNDPDLTEERMTEIYADNLVVRDLWELARNETDEDTRLKILYFRTHIQIPVSPDPIDYP